LKETRRVIVSVVKIIFLVLAGIMVCAGLWLGLRRLRSERRYGLLKTELRSEPERSRTGDVFRTELVEDLPDPARRFLSHAIKPGTPLAGGAEIVLEGSMRQSPDTPRMSIRAEEILVPGRGFLWDARARRGPVTVRVVDHYLGGEGAVEIALFGFIPLGRESGPDIARSSRGRLAAESIWAPTALLPGPGVRWEPVDDEHARVVLTVEGEETALTLTIDDTGRCREVTMQRWGDAGVESFQSLPYGFAIEEEVSSEGITVGRLFTGGWFYGTDRYDPENASTFTVVEIRFR